MRLWKAMVAAAAALCVSASALGAPPVYRITDLGVLPTHEHSRAADLNNAGQVVGDSQRFAGPGGPGERHVFIWAADTGLVDLGVLPGVSVMTSAAVNDAGQVVGYYDNPNGLSLAFAWSAEGGLQDVGTLSGGASSQLTGIDDAGRAVGHSSAVVIGSRAVEWHADEGLAPLAPDRRGSQAWAVNDAGQIAVTEVRGWRDAYRRAALREPDGRVVPLGDLPTDAFGRASTWPTAVNDAGQVVGASNVGDGRRAHAFVWSRETGMRDLGTLPGAVASIAHDVNRQGAVVGSSGRIAFRSRMFLWTPAAGMLDVNDLVDPADPLKGVAKLDEALAINDRGQIAGNARIHGLLRAVLLTPVR